METRHGLKGPFTREACKCDSFEEYVKLERLPMDYGRALNIARQGEVEQHLEIHAVRAFSGRSLLALATIRQEKPDGTTSHPLARSPPATCLYSLHRNGPHAANFAALSDAGHATASACDEPQQAKR